MQNLRISDFMQALPTRHAHVPGERGKSNSVSVFVFVFNWPAGFAAGGFTPSASSSDDLDSPSAVLRVERLSPHTSPYYSSLLRGLPSQSFAWSDSEKTHFSTAAEALTRRHRMGNRWQLIGPVLRANVQEMSRSHSTSSRPGPACRISGLSDVYSLPFRSRPREELLSIATITPTDHGSTGQSPSPGRIEQGGPIMSTARARTTAANECGGCWRAIAGPQLT
ncbi:hypothetical protein C8F04DRAFT_1191721 [Mycena alexandri]|uniref:Uncharacterized protein n=1 Tax=Mycena alexandri TaxID=1745969 RepID=A0AAD6SDB7_9AGAR|nr:hypothetical protein C8F04DRAFT_1191721 [Mycena alexandri]